MESFTTPGELVFVCGPLRQEGSHASLMDVRAELTGQATVEGSLYVIAWFPGFLPEKGKGKVVGELYHVTPELLDELDEFERRAAAEVEGAGCQRVKVEAKMLTLSGDRFFEAWAWEWRGSVEERLRIPTGNWFDFISPPVFPWFTWIAATCVIAFPAFIVGGAVMESSRGALPNVAGTVIAICGMCAPFAALGALWFGMRAREKRGPLGCIAVFAIPGAAISGLVFFKFLSHLLAG